MLVLNHALSIHEFLEVAPFLRQGQYLSGFHDPAQDQAQHVHYICNSEQCHPSSVIIFLKRQKKKLKRPSSLL